MDLFRDAWDGWLAKEWPRVLLESGCHMVQCEIKDGAVRVHHGVHRADLELTRSPAPGVLARSIFARPCPWA